MSDDTDVIHVRDRGRQGTPDHLIIEWAYVEDRILVTANIGDFEKLAQVRGLHPGLVLIEDGQMPRGEQKTLMERVCIELRNRQSDTVNRALRVSIDGSMAWFDLPEDESKEATLPSRRARTPVGPG